MSTFRRRIMMATQGYIKNGLVFHLDGINKGANEGKWTDLVGGVVFENHGATPTYDGWEFNEYNADYLDTTSILNFPYNTSTIEITFIDNSNNNNRILFQTGVNESLSFGIITNSIVTYQGTTSKPLFSYNSNIKVNRISCTKDISIQNGISSNIISSTNSWDAGLRASIGKRVSNAPYPFSGKIYSIRIYNRHLTEDEMRHNQEIDYKRFDLANVGKTIRVISPENNIDIKINGNVVNYPIEPNRPSKIVVEDTSINSIEGMFKDNTTIKSIDLSNLKLDGCFSISEFVKNCSSLEELILPPMAPGVMNDAFVGLSSIETLDLSNIVLYDVLEEHNFSGCNKLVNLIPFKEIQTSINLEDSPLSHESALAVIDNFRTGAANTITFSNETWLTLTDEDEAIAEEKNWTIVAPSSFNGKIIKVKSTNDSIDLKINGVTKTYAITPNEMSKIVVEEKVTNISSLITLYNVLAIDLSNLDLSGLTKATQAFYNIGIKDINFGNNNPQKATDIRWMFELSRNLKDVNIQNWDMGNILYSNDMFTRCDSLVNLKFGYNFKLSIDFASCPLTHESALSVINGLAEVTITRTLTFRYTTYDTLTDDEIALATSKGWSVLRGGVSSSFVAIRKDYTPYNGDFC